MLGDALWLLMVVAKVFGWTLAGLLGLLVAVVLFLLLMAQIELILGPVCPACMSRQCPRAPDHSRKCNFNQRKP